MLDAVAVEPVPDIRQLFDDGCRNAGLLEYLACCRVLGAFVRLDVTLRQRPDARRTAPDQQRVI